MNSKLFGIKCHKNWFEAKATPILLPIVWTWDCWRQCLIKSFIHYWIIDIVSEQNIDNLQLPCSIRYISVGVINFITCLIALHSTVLAVANVTRNSQFQDIEPVLRLEKYHTCHKCFDKILSVFVLTFLSNFSLETTTTFFLLSKSSASDFWRYSRKDQGQLGWK